jgi:hypothetical protein
MRIKLFQHHQKIKLYRKILLYLTITLFMIIKLQNLKVIKVLDEVTQIRFI